MLGDIGSRPAIFAAEREALHKAQRYQDEGRGDADRFVAGQQADRKGRQAHQRHRHQEGIFAADQIADPTENERAKRPHRETGGEGGER